MKRLLIALAGLLILGALAGLVAQKERTLASGTRLYLRLRPVDPRSLMQGDYMDLRYDLARLPEGSPGDGLLAVTVDARGVGVALRRHDGGALGPAERLLRYRLRNGELRLGAESYFFEEGRAKEYDGAWYGELRVDPAGNAILVGLADERLARLGPAFR